MRRRLWSRVAGTLIAALGLAALPLGVGLQAQAAEACTTRNLSQPFGKWGDFNNYFPVTSGTFESGTSGWSIGPGVTTVAENEPWRVAGGSSSLRIPAGSSASTAEMCLTADEDSARFFYKSPGNGQSLSVTIRATNTAQHITYITSFTISAGWVPGWQLTPRIALPDVRGTTGVENVIITLAANGSAAWQIDDVFVDPSRTR
jgi:hypothetical protein